MSSDGILSERLCAEGVISKDDLLRLTGLSPAALFQNLHQRPDIPIDALARSIAAHLGLEFIEAPLEASAGVAAIIDFFIGEELPAFPLTLEAGVLTVAVSNPFDFSLIEKLEHRSKSSIALKVATPEAIAGAHVVHGKAIGAAGHANRIRQPRAAIIDVSRKELTATQAIDAILTAAIERGATDIHMERTIAGTQVRFRIDGVLSAAVENLPAVLHERLVQRVKVLSELDVTERRIPQDGRFRLQLHGEEVDFRVSVLPGFIDEEIAIRVLDKRLIVEHGGHLGLASLGLAEPVVRQLRRVSHLPYGLMLVAGPTGSGKTTTLYSILNETDREKEKVVTIEDPVEYRLDGVLQVPVNEKKQLTFARGLRSILRHDPDKIMVGEIRDGETAEIAVQSALTGHLVLSTIHANNAVEVVGRITNMGVDAYTFVNVLTCVLAQRLVRKVCTQCREPVTIEPTQLQDYGLAAYAGYPWYAGRGCDACGHTGYRGRMAIAEIVRITPAVRQAMLERKPPEAIEQLAIQEGMVPMREEAIRRALAGETTFEEINRVTLAR